MKTVKLYLIAALLVILYILSFSPLFTKEKKQKSFESVFLNKKNVNSVKELCISNNKTSLVLSNNENLWTGVSISDNSIFTNFLVDKEVINKIITNLQQVTTIYIVADNLKQQDSFGLSPTESINFEYTLEDGTKSFISIGKEDFSKQYRYILINNKDYIYKTSFDFSEILHTETRFWYEPYIIPRNLFDSKNYSDIQKISISRNNTKQVYIPKNTEKDNKLLELRHGAICTYSERENPIQTLTFFFDDSNILKMTFYKEDDYIVNCQSKIINYSFHISEWTYQKIQETFK